MLLDDLVTAIQTVQQRIREHGTSLSQNEYRTRLALIDPILNALGWDASDPKLVTIEDQYSGGRPDYALLGQNKDKPVAFIEAKRLNEPLNAHEDQVFKYTWDRKVFYAGLTDGNRWIFRDVTAEFSQPPREGLLLDVTLAQGTAYQCALKLLLLWNPTLTSEKPTRPSEPILVTHPKTGPLIETSKPPTTTPQPPIPPVPSLEWISLARYMAPAEEGHQPRPSMIYIPDKGECKFHPKPWNRILVEAAEWLIRGGQITAVKCPINSVGKTALVNTNPRHENGDPFKEANTVTLSNGLFLNTLGNRHWLVDNAKLLIEHCGQDPAAILLKPSQ